MEMKSLLLLGRQPALGLAELESLYGSDSVVSLGEHAAISDMPAKDIDFARLGGSVKLCAIEARVDSTNWKKIEKELLKRAPDLFSDSDEGKIHLGLSVYGAKLSPLDIQATALRVKKVVRAKTGRTVRVAPNTANALSSAQIIHHRLTGTNGAEIVVYIHGNIALITKMVAEQDIEAYARRDQNRPKRDARVGMLPPKLAQIIINLAAADKTTGTLLDPFCGTGVVLQEAALIGFTQYGSDLEQKMIDYTHENLEWLTLTHSHTIKNQDATLETGDATEHTWNKQIDIVACEGYLGQPFSSFPAEEKLRDVMQTCNAIMKGFLKNIHSQIEPGTRLCVALPAWHRPNGSFEHLKFLDSLEELGYNRVSFVHTSTQELLYYRPNQVVARELLVITRK
jgi:tRNA G10  N-methylase Trm11